MCNSKFLVAIPIPCIKTRKIIRMLLSLHKLEKFREIPEHFSLRINLNLNRTIFPFLSRGGHSEFKRKFCLRSRHLNHSLAANHELTHWLLFVMFPNQRTKAPSSKANKRICRRILLFSLIGLCVMEESCVWESRAHFSLLFLLTEAQGVFACFPNRCPP